MSRRTDRIAELIRAELSELILHRVKDPRVRLASVATVQVTGDLSRATIGVSVLGEEEDREQVVEALSHAAGFLRSQLGRRLRLRVAPQLLFELDRGAEHSQRISDLLETLDVHNDDAP
ncbi:MAG: 30S ribosome-binding factor RbfA [Deltaproteobacteria bacterium]|nr:30S ribosome-binding factor RbfA [Deltaproteobacteria bacterium]